jgi:hypothetical protein
MPATPLPELLLKHRHTFALHDGRLAGEGAELLYSAVEQSQFFLIGEEHGVAEIPLITAALFQAGTAVGYKHLAIEVGPLLAQSLTSALEQNGRDGLAAFIHSDPLAIPFYSWREDAELLQAAYTTVHGTPNPLWGLDQEFVFSGCFLLRQLRSLASQATATEKVEQALVKAQELRAASQPCLFVVQEDAYTAMKEAFQPNNRAAWQILEALETSFHIYQLFGRAMRGEIEAAYHSNAIREQLMKTNFSHYCRQAQETGESRPKALLRFGSNHMHRGQSPTKVFSLGNFVSELAHFHDSQAFNLLIVGGPGTRVQSITGEQPAEGVKNVGLQPLMEHVDRELWTLFDLRPLRPVLSARRLADTTMELAEIIWKYDAVAILSRSTPAAAFTHDN